jgi:hypothetical protein
MAGTVRITARFNEGGIEEGFGFIIGKRAAIFVVRASTAPTPAAAAA